MTRLASRSLGVPLAVTGAALLGLTPMIDSAFAYGDSLTGTAAATDPDIGLIMGGSGEPIPGADFVDAVNSLYVQPNFPGTIYPGTLADGLVTPEDLYPLTGVHSLPLDTSVSEGVTIVNNSIENNIAAGDVSTVFGYSQSGIIASLEMEQLDPSGTPSPDPVDFVLIGDPMNPDGGFWERFAGLDIASIGATLYGATPADDFTTVIYTGEYDGVADFPQYPLNLLSDLNAELGFLYVHGTYPDLTPTQVTPVSDGGDAIQLMTSGPTETTYYMIPTTDLPLLDPVRDIPVIGNPLADLLQPDLTYLVNLGYGDPLQGWSTGPANVATGFGLFPPFSDIEKLPGLLLSGTEQGIQDFIGDFAGTGPNPVTLSIGSLLDPSSAALPSDPATSITDIVNALSSAASALYSALLPTADLINSLVTTIPAYDASIFTDNLAAGNVLDALGLPIAADTGLVSMGALLEISVVADAASTALSDLTSLIP
jgi:hypothetical protein